MYVCGVTVYDYCHLGHARALVTFDVIYRVFLHKGYKVTYVRNFTDVDDKIIQRAQQQGIDYRKLTEKFIEAFHKDATNLGLRRPTHEPRATEHIAAIIKLIQCLVDKGLAYQAGGDVFFSVRKFKNYGQLSGKNVDELAAGARVEITEAKHDPLDFALWKAAKPGEPKWPSPWGDGRPGWHIECSAMSMAFLSESFDIHGGGRDLIFPHHENEIAQAEGCSQKPFAKYWIHNGFVNINAEKMSKSLGNFMTLTDIFKQYPGEVVRLFILSAHYRSPLDYTDQNIYNAAASLERYYETILRLKQFCKAGISPAGAKNLSERIRQFRHDFEAALDDDFNTAKVVGAVFEWIRQLNKALDENRLSVKDAEAFLEVIDTVHEVFGVFGSDAREFLNDLKKKGIKRANVSEDEITRLIEERKQARKDKNFKRADEIRDALAAKGIQLKDNPDGSTTWTVLR